MTCSLCSAVALRVVGKKGFCKAHRPEANKASMRNKSYEVQAGYPKALYAPESKREEP